MNICLLVNLSNKLDVLRRGISLAAHHTSPTCIVLTCFQGSSAELAELAGGSARSSPGGVAMNDSAAITVQRVLQGRTGLPQQSEVEQVLELLVQSDADDQGELCRRAELARLYGADRVAGYANHLGELRLREPPFGTRLLEAIL